VISSVMCWPRITCTVLPRSVAAVFGRGHGRSDEPSRGVGVAAKALVDGTRSSSCTEIDLVVSPPVVGANTSPCSRVHGARVDVDCDRVDSDIVTRTGHGDLRLATEPNLAARTPSPRHHTMKRRKPVYRRACFVTGDQHGNQPPVQRRTYESIVAFAICSSPLVGHPV